MELSRNYPNAAKTIKGNSMVINLEFIGQSSLLHIYSSQTVTTTEVKSVTDHDIRRSHFQSDISGYEIISLYYFR